MNKNETIADIRKEAEARFRELLEKHVDSLGHIQAMQQFNQVFDRIEAAWKRERAEIEANALAVGGVVEASRNKPSGDAAAMREALGAVAELFWEIQGLGRSPISNKAYAVKRKVIAALAKPPRNCDRFGGDYKMLHTAWSNWTASPSGRNPNNTMKMTFSEWLLALANEKGENDGSKQRTGAA